MLEVTDTDRRVVELTMQVEGLKDAARGYENRIAELQKRNAELETELKAAANELRSTGWLRTC
jgi:predicted  nucleic acid-binding Zn-ribbon protein